MPTSGCVPPMQDKNFTFRVSPGEHIGDLVAISEAEALWEPNETAEKELALRVCPRVNKIHHAFDSIRRLNN